MAEHRSFCRICAAACGILVTVEDNRVVKVMGDSDHPVSRGYTCEKGRALPQLHHSQGRLDRPRTANGSVEWTTVLDELAHQIDGIRSTSGPDAVAMYLATGMAYDSAGQVACGMWMGALGSSSFYSAATVDNAPVLVAAERIAGHAMLNPVWEPESSRLVLFLGTNPVISHGYGTTLADPIRRLREARAVGSRLWTIDPRRTESAAHVDEHLAVRPGSDVILLAALLRQLLRVDRCRESLEGSCRAEDVATLVDAVEPFTMEVAVIATGCDLAQLERLLSDLSGNFGRVAMFCGTGTTMAIDGILVEWLRWVLLVATGSLDVEGGMRFNRGIVNQLSRAGRTPAPNAGPRSRPELPRVAGQIPAVALVDEIESGTVRALFIAGGNPLSAFPEPDRLRQALSSLEVLVVLDVAETEMTELATHVLPATSQLERADLTLAEHVSFRPGMQYSARVVEPEGSRRPVWWILAEIARRLDRPMFGGVDPESLHEEVLLRGLLGHGPLDADDVITAGSHGIDVDRDFGWVRNELTPEGVWNIAPRDFVERLAQHKGPEVGLVLLPRRVSAWSNSVRCAGVGDEAVVLVNRQDAEDRALLSGDWVAVTSRHGSLVATVAVDDSISSGTISVTHGHPGSLTGTLTSTRIDVDPLTTMPRTSGLPVTIEKLGH